MRMLVTNLFTLGLLLLAYTAAAEIPQVITYQGCLADSLGDPVPDGAYDLTLTMYTAPEGVNSVWLCEGQTVQVIDGLFEYMIGEACAIPPDFFVNHDSLWLGIAVGEGQELAPRTKINSVAYAFRAQWADSAVYVASGAAGWVDDGTVVRLETPADSVGVGTAAPVSKLDVDGSINAATWYKIGGNRVLSDSGNGNILVGVHAGQNNIGISNTIMGYYAGIDNQGSNNVFIGRACGQSNTSGSENTFLGVSAGSANSYGNNNTYLGHKAGISAPGENNTFIGKSAGANATGSGNVFIGHDAGYYESGYDRLFIANSSTVTPLIFGNFELGTVGLGTTNPAAKLHVINESGTAITAEASGVMINAIKGITSSSGGAGVRGSATGMLGTGVRGYATGLMGYGLYGDANQDSSYGVYGNVVGAASHGVYGSAAGDSGHGVYGIATGVDGHGVYGEASGPGGHGVHAITSSEGGRAVYAKAFGDDGIGIEAVGGWTGYAAKFRGNVILVSKIDGETILELGEGLDYAEGFDVSQKHEIDPGTVVIIDPDNPGKLAVSNSAYDSKVAGIVAGANGLGSGVRLGGDKYDMDVALAGRVYCNVDATTAAIEPGDLLTTSSLPGYAMKANDHNRTRGAILGKAMQRMEKGQKGKILVLVTLQ